MAEVTETEEQSCAVCGRRLLLGERSSPYVSREGIEVAVCELCKPRAESAGWMRPEDAAAGAGQDANRRRRRGRGELLGGLLARRERAERGGSRESAEPVAEPPSEAGEAPERLERERSDERGEAKPRSRPGSAGDRGSRGRRARPRADGSDGDQRRVASAAGPDVSEAIAAFNASEARRTIAGLSRSLGEPRVSGIAVRTASGDTGARLTVAWELAWYQWEVGPGRRGPEIRQIAKGETIDQLHAADRKWNLQMAEDGSLSTRSAPRS